MLLSLFTLAHVVISLVGILAGFFVLAGLLTSKSCDRWTAIFLVTTISTSVTGFLFPVEHFLPSHAVGILSIIVLSAASFARYARELNGAWRPVYVIGSILALYFNVFVAIVQAFLNTPALKALAPTQTEFPFKVTQLAVLVLFIALGVMATIRFRPAVSQKISFA